MLNMALVSPKLQPLTVIKGAGHEFIPIPEGESAIVADFHSYVHLFTAIYIVIVSFQYLLISILDPSDSSEAFGPKPPIPRPILPQGSTGSRRDPHAIYLSTHTKRPNMFSMARSTY